MNKTQYDYLKHSAKGQTWRNHKYTRIENGRYIYDEGNGDDGKPKRKTSLLDTISNAAQKGVSDFGNQMENTKQQLEGSQQARAVTAMVNLAESYADKGDYQSVVNLFTRYYGQLSPAEKREILKEEPNNKRDGLEMWAGQKISDGKSIQYITAGCIYKYAMGEGVDIVSPYTQKIKEKTSKAKEYGQNFINNVKPKQKVQSVRSKSKNIENSISKREELRRRSK